MTEDPGFGTYVSYSIAAGSLVDLYGNTNAAFSVKKGYICSYGYTVDDLAGEYEVASKNAFTSTDSPAYKFTIEASDDEEKGNIIITNYLDIEGKLYAEVDLDSGVFSIAKGEIFSGDETSGYCTFFYKDKVAEFKIPAAGTITSEYYIGAAVVANGSMTGYASDSAGNSLLLYDFVATRK